ncbi:phage tail protein [Acinetobacter sp. UGAL515B_02]|nr:phage tail protein [Acinetobacter sp. UGAL515B_02]WON79091.1 phage tail protein [Acinetobacter sp. UGAL515B_02]
MEINAVRLRLKWGALRSTNASTGDVTGVTIRYAVDVSTDGAAYVEVLNTQISDKTSASYERSHRIDLPKSESGWNIRVRRLTPPAGTDYVTDQMYVASYAEVIDAKFRYPNTALLGLQYDAETFSSVAKVAIRARGTKIRVPSNYNPKTRVYSGIWDGSFKRAYSNNPAWIYYDLCTAKRYGLGGRISTEMLDKASLYKLGQYCDGLVSDGAGGLEPRFTCNVYIQSADDAYTILIRLAGVFRAISYWDGDSIVCDADMPQDVFFNYTNANVIDGTFEYTGTRARDRHTVAKVAWDNPDNRFKTEYEFVRDQAAIAKHGVKVLQLDAWGCTSRGQAQRAGAWAIRSEQKDTQSVTFKVGLDGNIPLPGKVISVADNDYAGRFIGGRVSGISEDLKHITLDREITAKSGDTIYINSEAGEATSRMILSVSGREVIVGTPFDAQSVAAQNAWTIDSADLATRKFRVISVKQDDSHQFTVTALEYNSSKFDEIDSGAATVNVPVSIINPVAQAAVTDIQIEAYDSVQQGLSVATMVISWTKAEYAVKYLVEWRKDDGSWIKLPLTGNTSVEVQGIYAGSYTARVTAISAFDVASLATTSNLTILSGKQGKPPKVTFIEATGILFGMKLNWGFPLGALDTAYTEIQVSPNGTSNIAQLGLFAYPTSTHTIQGLQPNLIQFYQARLIDRIGNVGEWSDWTSATTSADASDVLDILSGKISDSQLHQDLQQKIDKINVIEGDLTVYDQRIQDAKNAADQANQNLAVERQQRINDVGKLADDIASESQARISDFQSLNGGIVQERQQRITAVNQVADNIASESQARISDVQNLSDGLTHESQQRTAGDEHVLSVVDTYKQSTENSFAAVRQEIDVVADDLSAASTKLDGVYAKVTPLTADQDSWTADSGSNEASSWSIQSAQVDGDSALGQRIDTINVQVGSNQAAIQEERSARASGDEANAQAINNYIARNDTALASVKQTAESAVTASSSNSSAIQALDNRVDVAESDASVAKTNAASAITKAETAVTTAGSASSLAQQASATATAASDTASTANSNASNAVNTANTANNTANEAKTNAATALSTANAAASESAANASQINSINAALVDKASTGALESVKSEVEEIDGRLTAATEKVDGVYAKVTPLTADQDSWTADSDSNEASSWSIQSAYTDGDSALGQRIDTINVEVGKSQAAIQEERTARASGDEANTQAINNYIARNDTALASVKQTAESAVTASSSNSSAIQALDNRVDVAESDASVAKTNAASAITKAETAVTTAGSASSLAQQASATATAASDTAGTANSNASNAVNTANTAKNTANEAKTNAATALSTANAAASESAANASQINSINAALVDKASTGALESVKSEVNEIDGRLTAATEKVDGVYAKVTPLTADQDNWTADSGSNQASSWSIQSAQVDGDSALSQRLDIVSTTVGENTATIKEVTESVDGLYVQKYIKLDVNGKVAGWGGANDGVESQFIFNFDSLAIGSGNSTGYYPFIFRTTPFTDPVTGTVFPVSAYLKSAMMDYQSVKTSHIDNLAVKTGQIDDLAVTRGKIANLAVGTGQIDNLAVDTLKIKDNAVTVPVSAFAEASTSVGSDYMTVQTLAVPADMGHTILTFGAVFSFASYTSQQRLLCRVLKNGNVVFEDLEVHFIDYASVAVVSGSSGNHSHGLQINVSGTASDAGSHSHGYSGSTNSSTAGSGNTSHSHSYSGTTGSAGSHSHSLNLNASATSFNDGIHSHDVSMRGSARSAGTLNISRHDSTLIAGTFELQLRSDSGGSVNVSQRYIHAMTMRK